MPPTPDFCLVSALSPSVPSTVASLLSCNVSYPLSAYPCFFLSLLPPFFPASLVFFEHFVFYYAHGVFPLSLLALDAVVDPPLVCLDLSRFWSKREWCRPDFFFFSSLKTTTPSLSLATLFTNYIKKSPPTTHCHPFNPSSLKKSCFRLFVVLFLPCWHSS